MGDRTEAGDQRTNLNNQHINNDGHVVELQETNPLLNSADQRSNCCDKTMLICLALMLIVGFSIGTYLLCVEGKDDVPEKLIIVPRTVWSTHPDIANISRLLLPGRRLVILETDSNGCLDISQCFEELRNLQRYNMETYNEPDITYNFIFGGDGRVYEGRGWRYKSTFNDADILTLAFLGNYDNMPPSTQQEEALKAFLDYAIMRDNLIPCFNTLVFKSNYLRKLAYSIEKQEKIENGCY